jgi:hypothetical protein
MRRMLLLGCAVAVAGAFAVVAVGADEPAQLERRGPDLPERRAGAPTSGPFAVAAAQAQAQDQAEASAERHRAARAAHRRDYDVEHDGTVPRVSSQGGQYPRPRRMRLIEGIAGRLGVGERRMWDAVAAVRRQISPRGFSDARDEAVAILAWELHRRPSTVARAMRAELRAVYGGRRP